MRGEVERVVEATERIDVHEHFGTECDSNPYAELDQAIAAVEALLPTPDQVVVERADVERISATWGPTLAEAAPVDLRIHDRLKTALGVSQEGEACYNCNGTGYVNPPCVLCHGTGRISDPQPTAEGEG